ncbi:MAG: hypothetical protein CME65_00080 [Halobacteriovoraceae bacterium]|nr:hypothetical protein [Halobacteriovoraceae bacterium]
MKALLVLLILLSFASCSFKSDDGGGDGSGGSNEGESNQRETNENESNENSANDRRVIDLDSDLLKDRFEKENGLDPFIADIPIVKAKFLQNYSIKAVFEDESTFEIDT